MDRRLVGKAAGGAEPHVEAAVFELFTEVLNARGGRRKILARLGPEAGDPLDLARVPALAHTLKAFANRLGDCRGHALAGGFRQFPGQPMGLLVLYVQAHDLPIYHSCLPFYHNIVNGKKRNDFPGVSIRSSALREYVLMLAVADDQDTRASALAHHEFESGVGRIDGDE